MRCIIFFFIFCNYIFYKDHFNNILLNPKSKLDYTNYQLYKYKEIREKLMESKCSFMWSNQREFLNGIIRKFKPLKILEIGVYRGGSSIIILNAIEDIQGSKLFSIDLDSNKFIGTCVNEYFPKFLKNWHFFKGNFATEYMEKIGNNIDLAFFDTAHFEPGEILDFLIALPFLRKEAIVIFHDIAGQITSDPFKRNEWAPYIIFNAIRGQKFFPSGNCSLKQNIGAIKLEKDQKKYYKDYFRLLGGQWQYFPKEIYINQTRKFFKKYYDEECLMIFEEAVSFNRDFVRRHPKSRTDKLNAG